MSLRTYRASVLRLHDLWREANDESGLPDDLQVEGLQRLHEAVERAERDVREAMRLLRRTRGNAPP